MAPEAFRSVPIEVNVRVAETVAVAVNLYQTSSSGLPIAQPTGMPPLAVALHTVPATGVAAVKVMAPAQLSFAGWAKASEKQKMLKKKNTVVEAMSFVMVLQGFDPQNII
jgi:hypothetical protein